MQFTKLVHDLKNIASSNKAVDENLLSDRLLMQWIDSQRAIWLRNEYNKNRSIESNVYQTLSGLELIQVDKSDFSYMRTDYIYLRTKERIPKPLELHNRYIAIIRTTVLGDEPFNLVKFDNIKYKGYGKYNKEMVYAFFHDGYIYINVTENNEKIAMLEYISVDMVAENPIQVFLFKGENPLYGEYPLPMSLWEYMKTEILKVNLNTFLATKEDGSPYISA